MGGRTSAANDKARLQPHESETHLTYLKDNNLGLDFSKLERVIEFNY
jgi:hypothetical protein